MSDRDKNRRTGRTSRMIKYAAEQAQKGRAVYVLAANDEHARLITSMAFDLLDTPERLPFKVETEQTLGNLDFHSMALRGAHPNCLVVPDHFAIEHKFEHLYRMMHQWDEPLDG